MLVRLYSQMYARSFHAWGLTNHVWRSVLRSEPYNGRCYGILGRFEKFYCVHCWTVRIWRLLLFRFNIRSGWNWSSIGHVEVVSHQPQRVCTSHEKPGWSLQATTYPSLLRLKFCPAYFIWSQTEKNQSNQHWEIVPWNRINTRNIFCPAFSFKTPQN